jgi:putative salt-induced outer membrane protein YdiY/ketosteroid isomerase-like protein
LLAVIVVRSPALQAQALEKELRAAEERLAAALIAKDVDAFETLLAADFVLRGSPDVTRDGWIDNARTLCWGDQFEIADLRVVPILSETAIVTLTLVTNRDPASCEPAVIRSLLTDVWRRQDEGWTLVLRHSGPAGSSLDVQFARTAAPPPVIEGSAELSLVSTGGNSDTETLGLGGSVIWRAGRWTTDGQVSFIRGEAFDVETARSLVTSVRQGRAITPRLDAFGRLDYLVNEFAGIDRRSSVDAGLGYKAVDTGPQRLRLDVGIGYSHETRVAGADVDSALTNIGAVYRWRLHRAASLDNASLLTASLDRGDDWRLRNTLAVTTTMTRRLSLKVAHDLKYVNLPAPGFATTDRSLSAALVAKF